MRLTDAVAGMLLAAMAAAPVAAVETRVDAVAFAGRLDYSHSSLKDSSSYRGLYAYVGRGLDHQYELSLQQIDVEFLGGAIFRQRDLTSVYTNYTQPGWRLRGGFHAIDSDRALSGDGLVLFLGAHGLQSGPWDLGLDVYRSSYSELAPDLTVWQMSPQLAFGAWSSAAHGLRSELRAHLIFASDDIGLGRREFRSAEERLIYTWRRWTLTASGWAGNQGLAVRDDGFTVFNLPERHEGGYSFESRYRLGGDTTATVRTAQEIYREAGAMNRSSAQSWTASVGHTF